MCLRTTCVFALLATRRLARYTRGVVAFIRKETRRGKTVFRVVDSRRVRGKKHPQLVTLAYLGEDPDIDAHLALAERKIAARRKALRTAKQAARLAAKRPDWKLLEDVDADLVALEVRAGQQARKFTATFQAAVEESLAAATARRGKLREVRRKLKAPRARASGRGRSCEDGDSRRTRRR